MFLLGYRRKWTALALCKSIEFVIQWFQINHKITFAAIQNPAVYLSGARISIFPTLVPQLLPSISCPTCELLAVTVFEIPSFLLKFAKVNNEKNKMIFFHQVVYSLSSIS